MSKRDYYQWLAPPGGEIINLNDITVEFRRKGQLIFTQGLPGRTRIDFLQVGYINIDDDPLLGLRDKCLQ